MDLTEVKSFDYIFDYSNWIYLVKGICPINNCLIATPIYSPNPERQKNKTLAPIHSVISHPLSSYSGANDRMVPTKEVAKHVQSDIPIDESVSSLSCPPTISSLISNLNDRGISVSLFGSRLLGIDHESSDWDLLISDYRYPQDLVELITSFDFGGFRRFNKAEVKSRVARYVKDEPWLNSPLLTCIFDATTTYLKSDVGEIGLFFTNRVNNLVPVLNDKGALDSGSIKGIVRRNDGKSYGMPREVELVDQLGRRQSIRTFSWSIGGIEELNGYELSFTGLRRENDNNWWFGCHGSKLDILTQS